jgi:hypothetical protein
MYAVKEPDEGKYVYAKWSRWNLSNNENEGVV